MSTHVRFAGLSSRRARLLALLVVATAAIGLLTFKAASSSVSYYVTPEEFAEQVGSNADARWRVGGRIVPGSIVQDGKSVAFDIEGEHGEMMSITYSGVIPNLFGPSSFVVIDGTSDRRGHLNASSVVIKHENEFVSGTPADGSVSADILKGLASPSHTPVQPAGR